MWTPEGKRSIVIRTGSHEIICIFGTITLDSVIQTILYLLIGILSFHMVEYYWEWEYRLFL
jgi:hypothetical protein